MDAVKRIIGIVVVSLTLSSCFEKEDAIPPYPRGDVAEQSFAMGAKYTDQFFYDIGTNTIVSMNGKTAWDIAFDCSDANGIFLNTGKNMYAARSSETDFASITDTTGLEFLWDFSNGKFDSTAMFGCLDTNLIWVLNLGTDNDNDPIGFMKVRIRLDESTWKMEYAPLESAVVKSAELMKNDQYNHVFFSFESDMPVLIEPAKGLYDLVFRQYIYYFAPEDLPYLVVGALINPNKTAASKVFNKTFSEVSLSDTLDNPFESHADVVGYDWKAFNLAEGVYVVFANQVYIVRDSEGFFYKIHFTDFYSTDGERGYPKVEVAQL